VKKCDPMAELNQEAISIMDKTSKGAVTNTSIIAAAQRI